jgi:hypothetical protein
MTRVADGGALAGAFAAAVAKAPRDAAAPAQSPSRDSVPVAADEWFIGINGTPVGPLRLSELRSRAQSGAIGTDNLVWREGFEEWLPLHKFPELVAIVEDGMSSARASLAPLAPPRELADPFAHSPAVQSPAGHSPAAQSAVGHSPAGHSPAGHSPAGVAKPPDSGPVPVAITPSGGSPTVVVDDSFMPQRKRGGMSMAAIFAMVVAVGLGLALGFVVFGGQKTKIVREVVQVPADRPDEGAPPPPDSSAPEAVAATDTAAAPAAKGAGSGSKGSSGGAKVEQPAVAPQGLSGLSGLKGLGGPQAGPSSGSVSSGGGQPLDSSQVQSTVGRYTSSVKRSCWQPALDTRDKDAPTSARVTVSITVGPDGKVRQATTSGDPKGYSGLASCISRRVQTWTFPPSSGTTTVNVPFVFAAQ